MEDVSIGSYHRVPQLLQFIHHPIGPFAFASLSALFKAFLTIGRSGFQHGVNDGKNLPGQRNRCPLRSFPLFHFPVPAGKVQLAVRSHDPCSFTKHAFQIGIALIDMNALSLTGTLIVAGTKSRL